MAIHLNDLIQPLNGLIAKILGSRFHWPLSVGLAVVSWSGRQSGRSFSIPVGYQPREDAIIVMVSKPASKNWWKNFRSPWPADLIVKGQSRSTMGEWLLPGSPDFFDLCEETLCRMPFMGSQLGGIQYDPGRGLNDAERALLIEHAGVLRFELLDSFPSEIRHTSEASSTAADELLD